jgi:hypothetical protein
VDEIERLERKENEAKSNRKYEGHSLKVQKEHHAYQHPRSLQWNV